MLTMSDVDIGLKRPATLPLSIVEKLLMVIGELYLGPRTATLTNINQVTMVDFCVYMLLILVFMKVLMLTK